MLLVLCASAVNAQEITVRNTAIYVGGGRYDWTVSLSGDTRALDSIRCVDYILHPSFPNPVQRTCDRSTGFALSSNGWGEFNMGVRILYRDGRETYVNHWLRLRQ